MLPVLNIHIHRLPSIFLGDVHTLRYAILKFFDLLPHLSHKNGRFTYNLLHSVAKMTTPLPNCVNSFNNFIFVLYVSDY